MKHYRDILAKQEKSWAAKMKKLGMQCQQLPFGKDTAVLYIAKPHWTNRFDPKRESTIGIFCSIWVTEKLITQGKLSYNIHSKQIRKLPGYKFTSIVFADEFRQRVNPIVADWPGISLKHGPGTLLQGQDTITLDNFESKVKKRITGFVDIHQEIDALLALGKNLV